MSGTKVDKLSSLSRRKRSVSNDSCESRLRLGASFISSMLGILTCSWAHDLRTRSNELEGDNQNQYAER